MHSYPNLIPERPEVIRRGLARLAPYRFERVYGAWWRRIVFTDGQAAVARSAERYLRFALGDTNQQPPAGHSPGQLQLGKHPRKR